MAYSNTGSDEDTYGFDCKFVEDPPTSLICPICAMILRDPHQTRCCGCHYCACCVQQLVKKTAPCVTCGGYVTAFRDASVTQRINALRVKCSNSYWGCAWTGDLGHLGEHLVTCEQKPTKCSSCSLFVPREICREHELSDCPKRPYTCTYCSNFTSAYEFVKERHWPMCPKFPIECPVSCSSNVKIPRDGLIKHLKEDCTIQEKIDRLSGTIEMLEVTVERKEQRIEDLEAEIQGTDRKPLKKSRSLFRRRGSRQSDDVTKETTEESHNRPRVSSDDARALADSVGKERNLEREVKVLKECIAEKVAEIEQLRLRNVEQCTSMAQMEEDFTAQLKAMKTLCKKLNDEKEELEFKLTNREAANTV